VTTTATTTISVMSQTSGSVIPISARTSFCQLRPSSRKTMISTVLSPIIVHHAARPWGRRHDTGPSARAAAPIEAPMP